MKARLIDDFRGLFGGVHKAAQHRSENGLGDIYVVHLVEKLNYCRLHPKSSRCQ
jgi:hypothetical protein